MISSEKTAALRFLYVTIFLTSTSAGTVSFLLSVYAEELGADYIQLGLIGAVGSVAYTTMTLISGLLLDRFHRVKIYWVFSLLVAAAVLMFSMARGVVDLMIIRALLEGSSATFWITASTLTAEISPPEILTTSIGRYNISWIVGFIVGPLFGGVISDEFGFPFLFVILSTFAAVSAVIIRGSLFSIKLGKRAPKGGFDLSALKGIRLALLTIVPYSTVLGVYMAILPGYMKGLGISSSVIGLLLTMTNGVRGLGFLNVKRFVDWSERNSLGLASCLISVALFVISFSTSILGFAVPLVMFGLAGGIITPIILNYIARNSRQESLGTVMGIHEFVYSSGILIGPAVGGIIAEAYQPSTLYLMLSAVSLAILPLSRSLKERA